MNEAPLNYLQNYVLEQQEAHPGTSMFNLAKMFRLKKGIDLERLADALAKAGRSHQALLSVLHRFPDGEVLQMQGLDEDEIQVEIVRVSERNLLARRMSYVKTFNTFDEGLVDAIVFDCGENSYLLSNIHHLVCDGYSFPLILEDAHRAWLGETLECDRYYEVLAKRVARSELPISVATRDFMREMLRSGTYTSLPAEDVRGPLGYGSFETELELPDDFEKIIAGHRATRHHVFLAAAVKALSQQAIGQNLLVDWVFHGRISKDELKTVGAFMVDIPLVVEDASNHLGDDLLSLVKHGTYRGIKCVNAFRRMDDCNPTGKERLTFIYQDKWGELMSPGAVDPEGPYAWMIEETIPLCAPRMAAENPFNVEIMEHKDSTHLLIEYDSGRYSEKAVREYADCYKDSLTWLLR